MKSLAGLMMALVVLTAPALAQSDLEIERQKILAANSEARAVFNSGRDLWDEGQYAEAEKKFREVLAKHPRSDQADKSAYYLITTLAKLGRGREAVAEIANFEKTYPQSKWMSDVQEKRISLTNEVPASLSIRFPQAPRPSTVPAPATPVGPAPASPAPGPFQDFGTEIGNAVRTTVGTAVGNTVGQIVGTGIGSGIGNGISFFRRGAVDSEVSLQQEILRVLLQNDPDRGIDIAGERLKADPSDPVVISNLHTIATAGSPKALPMLVSIAKTSTSSRARREAAFWVGRSPGDKDTLVNTLLDILSSTNDPDTESGVASALAEINTPRSAEALTQMIRDGNRSIPARRTALNHIGRTANADQLSMLEELYKNSSDSTELRRSIVAAMNRVSDVRVIGILANIAKTDTDMAVRRSAIQSLGSRKEPEALKALEDLLKQMPPGPRGQLDDSFEHEEAFATLDHQLYEFDHFLNDFDFHFETQNAWPEFHHQEFFQPEIHQPEFYQYEFHRNER